ncbi:uncharacterized protein LOC114451907 isoform X2 [Parambassis ranga]|nr:uncharacterized protein LOC114451907 isoform X2 [Parambassis ranga]
MVRHVIGRKHRQKYMSWNRPDLVSWDKTTLNSQGGKAIRAKAEIVERQDGRGKPVQLQKKQVEVSVSRGTRQKQTGDRGIPEKAPPNVPPLIPGLKSSKSDFSYRSKHYPDSSAFHPDEPDRYRDRREELLSRDCTKEERRREDTREGCMVRDDYIKYEDKYIEEPQRRMLLEPSNVLRYEELHHGQGECADHYAEKPTYERPYPERDRLKEFYFEEVRRGPSHSYEYPPSQSVYHEGVEQWLSREKESSRRDSITRGIQETSEPNTTKWSYRTPESEQSHNHLFSIIRDYQHKIREPNAEEAFDNIAPKERVEATGMFSDIPEPFRHFLKGPTDDEWQGKRKRKSRFSDATPEEQDMMKKVFSDEYGPPAKFGRDSHPVSAPLRPEINRRQYSHIDAQSSQRIESYPEGGSESEGVFDMLKNIEIENIEEAYFLKSKLCGLLKEFKAKKLEKSMQNSQSQASTSKGYDDPQLPRQHILERSLRSDSDQRQPDLRFRDDARMDHQQWEEIPNEGHTEYNHLAHRETSHSNRGCYEEEFGSPQTSHFDESRSYAERFQEQVHPRQYQTSVVEYFDSAAPPLHMEQDTRRNPRYSSNLDKITSTLLELVARK